MKLYRYICGCLMLALGMSLAPLNTAAAQGKVVLYSAHKSSISEAMRSWTTRMALREGQ